MKSSAAAGGKDYSEKRQRPFVNETGAANLQKSPGVLLDTVQGLLTKVTYPILDVTKVVSCLCAASKTVVYDVQQLTGMKTMAHCGTLGQSRKYETRREDRIPPSDI
jgi:hypothetical protein